MRSIKALGIGVLIAAVSGGAMATEEPRYTVLQQQGDFELRRYEGQIVAQTMVTGSQTIASQKGFKTLADYIFGNNTAPGGDSSKINMTAPVVMQPKREASAKIDMTAPVMMQADKSADNRWQMQFIMPSHYTMKTLPTPNNDEVTIIKLPPKTYGVIKFSGLAGSKKVAGKTKALKAWMTKQNLTMIDDAKLARFDPPWTLPFMRRNEVMIEYRAD